MRIRCIKAFRDNRTPGRPWREIGDEWEATPERLAAINRAGYGAMAEAVQEGAEPAEAADDAEDGREPAEATKRAAGGASAPQTVEELEAMTVRQLVELCILEGVETKGRPKHAELVAALKAHYGME